MKASTVASVVALAASSVSAHYTFPYLDLPGGTESSAFQYVRMTDNHYSLGPVTDVTTPQMKCYETTTASSTSTYTVAAGTTLSVTASGPIYHQGYIDVYMSAATPSANTESAGSGATWFKIFEDAPVYVDSTTGYIFPSVTSDTVTFTIPAALPSGDYLIRVEQIALHVASSFGGAQFYIGCAQVTVTGGGSGTPGPLVAFPGAYTGNEPGILIDIYAPYPSGAYISPGPPVWTGSGSSGTKPSSSSAGPTHSTTTKGVTVTTTSTTSKKPTTTTSSHPTTTTSAGTGAPLYGQCGGTGWTGPTTCAQGTCTVLNAYYSQCT